MTNLFRFRLWSVLALPSALAAQTYVRQAPVEVAIPKPPTPVLADGKRVFAYELHVTNFGARPLSLQSVEVFASPTAAKPIATLKDSSLRAAFQLGPIMQMSMPASSDASAADPTRIGSGERAIVFVWLAQPPAEPLPTVLRHRFTFAPLDQAGHSAGPVQTIDSVSAPLTRTIAVKIDPPLRGGEWLVGDGPSATSSHRRSLIPLNGKAWISQRFAIDWVKIGANGNTWHDDHARNENFWGFGEPVVAVADADVVATRDTIADNVPGKLPSVATPENISGNYVILRIGPSQYVMYAHLQQHGVRVHAGQRVRRGETLGLVGNSGQATAPHLHFQLMDAPADIAAEGIPFTFPAFTFLGFGRDYEPDKHPNIPKTNEMPVEDAVVGLPRRRPT